MVICGGVQTANATVYLIDTVLMPPAAVTDSRLGGAGPWGAGDRRRRARWHRRSLAFWRDARGTPAEVGLKREGL